MINELLFFAGFIALMIGPASIMAYDELLPTKWVEVINKRIMK